MRRSFSRARGIFPPLCRVFRREGVVGGRLWSRKLGLQPLEWAQGGKLAFSVGSSSTNSNLGTSKDEAVSVPLLESLRASEVRRVIGRDEEDQEEELDESESDEEDDGAYYDEDEDEFDNEFEDNEEDAEAIGAVKVATGGSAKSGKDRERLKALCARVQASGDRTVTAGDIAGLYDFQFDKFQVWLPSLQQWFASFFFGGLCF